MKNLLMKGVLAFGVLALPATLGIAFRNSISPGFAPGGSVACTMEAKICSDGTAVGRTGPDCQFAACSHEEPLSCASGACPGPQTGVPLWKTFPDPATGASFQYPERLLTKFTSTQDLPPTFSLASGIFSCTEGGSEIAPQEKTVQRLVDERKYCLTTRSEGAAGSVYTTYRYTTAIQGKLATFSMTLRSAQCGNYDEPEKSQCEAEREVFDLDGIVDRMAQSLTIR